MSAAASGPKKKMKEKEKSDKVTIPDVKPRKHLLVKPEIKWFENQPNLEQPSSAPRLPVDVCEQLHKHVAELMKNEKVLYQTHLQSRKKRGNYGWIQTVLKSGTVSDRMAAFTLLIQDSPVHNVHYLDMLISMVNVKAKRECAMAIDTLRDLFIGDLLLQKRKLKNFSENPLSHLMESLSKQRETFDKQLLLWHFEGELKLRYIKYVKALEEVSHDVVESLKLKAVSTMFQLLISSSEHEQVLLKTLINKLGDPKHRIASFTIQKLNHLLTQHPNMKGIVITEVEHLLFRPNISPRAQYYGICFMDQLLLSSDDAPIASQLIAIYFGFFKLCVKKNDVNSKMMSALLTGVNRAYPYARGETEKIHEQIDTMFKVVQTVRFHIGVQALMLIYHVLDSKHTVSDRYYCALYRKLIDPQLKHFTRLASFFNLLYKSLQLDDNLPRLQSFVKRLLQIALVMNAPISSAILILISEISRIKPKILVLEQHDALIADDDEECFKDVETESQMNDSDDEKLPAENVSGPSKGNACLDRQMPNSVDYMPLKRNPRYANAGNTCAWELNALQLHVHPSVALFAQKLLSRERIAYSGDPLQDFLPIRFLDRFVYRNPKTHEVNPEANQKRLIFGRRRLYTPSDVRRVPANSLQFAAKKETNIPVDEVFLHKYFTQQPDRIMKEDESDNDSVKSEDFEGFLATSEGREGELDLGNLDFSELSNTKQKKKKGKAAEVESSDSDDGDESDDFEEDDEFNDVFKEYDEDIAEAKSATNFDEEEALFSDDDGKPSASDFVDFDELPALLKRKKDSSGKHKKTISSESKTADYAAEEFAEMMDANASSKFDFSSTHALANKDNADVKQLNWEKSRDRWIRGATSRKRSKRASRPKGKPATLKKRKK